jgi:hypothetical protein
MATHREVVMLKTGILTICIVLCLNLAVFGKPQAMVKPATDGRRAALEWLALVDAGRYSASWNRADKLLQSRITRAEWAAGMKKVRALCGKVLSRKFKGSVFAVNPPGLPPGEHETLQFTIKLARHGQATEIVSMIMQSNGEWRVTGYHIAPINTFRASS